MRKHLFALGTIGMMLTMNGFGMSSTAGAKDTSAIKSVAVVSLSVSDVAGTVRGGSVGSTPVAKLMNARVNDMLADAETKLGGKWSVVNASGFIDNAGYQKAGVERTLTVYVPHLKGRDMPVFTQVSKEIKGGVLAPEKAKALCALLQVDAVVLIFSEWSAKTGGFVPTTKAITKNIVTIWDGKGKMVFKKRVDLVGRKTLGVGGMKAVNDQTIGEWTDSFSRSLDKIIASF